MKLKLKQKHYDGQGSGMMQNVLANLLLTFKIENHGCI